MRALIVDDSRAIRTILRRALDGCGFDEYVEAADGREALDAIATGPLPDVAFVDWNMPVMSGIDLVRAVRADAAYDGIAIVMVTSETALPQIEAALEAGADEYVMKPFTADVINEKLAFVPVPRV